MTARHNVFVLLLTRVTALAACFCVGEGASFAQVDTQDALQIIPPPVPRYRRIRPAFQVNADPTVKPIVTPPIKVRPMQADPEPVAPPETPAPSPEEIAKKLARMREIQRLETEREVRHARLITVGKVLGFIVVVLIGIAAVADIVRQVRIARQLAVTPADAEADEWEP